MEDQVVFNFYLFFIFKTFFILYMRLKSYTIYVYVCETLSLKLKFQSLFPTNEQLYIQLRGSNEPPDLVKKNYI